MFCSSVRKKLLFDQPNGNYEHTSHLSNKSIQEKFKRHFFSFICACVHFTSSTVDDDYFQQLFRFKLHMYFSSFTYTCVHTAASTVDDDHLQ